MDNNIYRQCHGFRFRESVYIRSCNDIKIKKMRSIKELIRRKFVQKHSSFIKELYLTLDLLF